MYHFQLFRWFILSMLGAAPSEAFFVAPSSSSSRPSLHHPSFQPLCLTASDTDGVQVVSTNDSLPKSPSESVIVYMFPIVSCVSAFTFYEGISKGFHAIVQAASQNKWIPVDGGQLIGDIILPAINGPVLGTIGLLFATLVSTTIGNLYQRQMSISNSVVREVDDLRRLGYLLRSLPEPYRSEAQMELQYFVNTVFDAVSDGSLAADRSEVTYLYRKVNMTPMFLLLNRVSEDVERKDDFIVSGNILGEGYELVRRINDERTNIAVLLRPAFPPLHYANLLALASCICLIFLIETDRDLIFFLAGFQLRLLWSILIGIFAMMASVIYDLETPFSGSYSVISSTDTELEILREHVSSPWDD